MRSLNPSFPQVRWEGFPISQCLFSEISPSEVSDLRHTFLSLSEDSAPSKEPQTIPIDNTPMDLSSTGRLVIEDPLRSSSYEQELHFLQENGVCRSCKYKERHETAEHDANLAEAVIVDREIREHLLLYPQNAEYFTWWDPSKGLANTVREFYATPTSKQ